MTWASFQGLGMNLRTHSSKTPLDINILPWALSVVREVPALCALHVHCCLQVGITIHWEMRKLTPREAKRLVWGHTGNNRSRIWTLVFPNFCYLHYLKAKSIFSHRHWCSLVLSQGNQPSLKPGEVPSAQSVCTKGPGSLENSGWPKKGSLRSPGALQESMAAKALCGNHPFWAPFEPCYL